MPSLRDSVWWVCSPGTYVPGFHIPPLRGWGTERLGKCWMRIARDLWLVV